MDSRKKKRFQKSLNVCTALPAAGRCYVGHFDGFRVTVDDGSELNRCGGFGKANLSRNFPNYRDGILRERQFSGRKLALGCEQKPQKVLVVPDSDAEDADYLSEVKCRYELDRSGFREVVCLGLEESYFLAKDLGCLKVYEDGSELDAAGMWTKFRETDVDFAQNYAVYKYYRSRNWVVKAGSKFGGDFVLYQEGPETHHAAFVVIIDVLDEKFERAHHLCRRSMSMKDLLGLNRLCETAAKELLICQLIWPSSIEELRDDNVDSLTVREVLMKRWVPVSND
ncbi:PREDICTED: tRNA-splicing endonuclease subunit Sen2 isoform X2 [Nicrophorus vespilloides]|uniref:tRNA-intron lyase n=1 Tax=Nicrophorus vespilloides TaxID=110193 RepID=A0ABM1LZV5_NICVS|nr:PREDICTED: tRNA-splicing endonuclease subunit Sen2 isoform X2 [Nicrophorus vespilloides]